MQPRSQFSHSCILERFIYILAISRTILRSLISGNTYIGSSLHCILYPESTSTTLRKFCSNIARISFCKAPLSSIIHYLTKNLPVLNLELYKNLMSSASTSATQSSWTLEEARLPQTRIKRFFILLFFILHYLLFQYPTFLPGSIKKSATAFFPTQQFRRLTCQDWHITYRKLPNPSKRSLCRTKWFYSMFLSWACIIKI